MGDAPDDAASARAGPPPEGDAQPAAGPEPTRAERKLSCPSLKQLCVNTLVAHRDLLGDVGYVDVESLRAIASHCSKDQLAAIQDETLAGSRRDTSWYCWHLWRRICAKELGAVDSTQVPPLPDEPPIDYTAPKGIDAEPADYRLWYLRRKGELDARTAAARSKIAAAYELEQAKKDSRKAKLINKLQPDKRPRPAGPMAPAAPPASAKLAKALKALGLPARSRSVVRPVPAPHHRPPPQQPNRPTGPSSSQPSHPSIGRGMPGASSQAGKAAAPVAAAQRKPGPLQQLAEEQQQQRREMSTPQGIRAAAVAALQRSGPAGMAAAVPAPAPAAGKRLAGSEAGSPPPSKAARQSDAGLPQAQAQTQAQAQAPPLGPPAQRPKDAPMGFRVVVGTNTRAQAPSPQQHGQLHRRPTGALGAGAGPTRPTGQLAPEAGRGVQRQRHVSLLADDDL